MDTFSSKVHRVNMELGGKLLISLRIETQFFERLQSVGVVDDAAHTQKDDVESNGGFLENVAKVFVLLFCGVKLVLRSGVLTVLDLDEVDVAPSFVEVFRSVLSGVGGCTSGCLCRSVLLRCSQSPSIAPCHSEEPTPPTLVCCFCVVAAMGVTSTKSGWLEVNLSLSWEAGWEEPFGNISTFSCFRSLEILHGHPFVAAYIHGDNA